MSRGAVGVGLLGCGTVGGALVSLLHAEAEVIAARTGVRLELARVAVKDPSKARPPSLAQNLVTGDALAVVTDPGVHVVVELIGGLEPARSLVRKALEAGKPVVTANKELLAESGSELFEVAAAAGLDLLYEAAVAGAIPLVRPLRESLAGERIRRVMGIVNGTTNYILTRMSEDGVSYDEAVSEAQALGYAERDPTADVGGHDAAAKMAILSSLAFGQDVLSSDVYREGIADLATADVAFARRLGYEVKLLGVAERAAEPAGPIAVRVHPALVPGSHPLATVRGSFNAVFIEGEATGELMLYGRGAGGPPTASAVLGDLIDAAHNLQSGGRGRVVTQERARIRPMDELRSQYYVSLYVVDQPGVLAAVAGVFGEHGVSIRAMEQLGLRDEARLVFITHQATERDVQATLAALRKLWAVESIGGLLRVAGGEQA
ncbi:MAG: homoserine dehydrogenase [Acidimicrobiales bacterium]|nr:homoserine dehydrogenase [Acidimicrobiales bacterium]